MIYPFLFFSLFRKGLPFVADANTNTNVHIYMEESPVRGERKEGGHDDDDEE